MLRMSKKLQDPPTGPKTYWSIVNWFLNNKKIPSILAIFHKGKSVSNFKENANVHLYLTLVCYPTSAFIGTLV